MVHSLMLVRRLLHRLFNRLFSWFVGRFGLRRGHHAGSCFTRSTGIGCLPLFHRWRRIGCERVVVANCRRRGFGCDWDWVGRLFYLGRRWGFFGGRVHIHFSEFLSAFRLGLAFWWWCIGVKIRVVIRIVGKRLVTAWFGRSVFGALSSGYH